MDVVKFTKLLTDEQLDLVKQLKEIVRSTDEFRQLESGNQLIRLSTGDGMALVFFTGPEAPARCALKIAKTLQDYPQIKLRMGINSGPVFRNLSFDDKEGVTGSGINMAQRVMDCGDSGHILLSSSVAQVLGELRTWKHWLHDLGEVAVKHDERIHLFNLYTDEVGNSEIPEKVRPKNKGLPLTPKVPDKRVEPITVTAPKMKVALLYKRHAQPDEHVLTVLETQLRKHGHEVFIDRHLKIGVEWANEIARQVSTSDAVIPLLSPGSIVSEMFAYEVQIAHEAAQKSKGKPRLLPVRIGFEAPLPDPLAGILNPIQYALWQSEEDDQSLVSELIESLRNPPGTRAISKLESVGGGVPLDSEYYIVRPTDKRFHDAIIRHDSIVLVKGARQMGKTSLLARGLQKARQQGARVVLTDFQKFNSDELSSIERLFMAIGEWIADQLKLEVQIQDVWNPRRGPNRNFERFFQHEVLDKVPGYLVWGLDEVDRLFTCDYGSEVFGLFRSWHNERSFDPDGPWKKLTMAISYATEAHLFISDLNQSPFNVGTRLTLSDFEFDEVAELNQRHGSPLHGMSELMRFYGLLSGHPYLVRRGLNELATTRDGLDVFEAEADREEGPFGDHLRRILVLLARDPALTDIVRRVLRGDPCPTRDSFFRLRSAGIISGQSEDAAKPRCRLYETYLKRHLL